MCRQSCCPDSSVEQPASAEENLLVYCKPVELYNILHRRSVVKPLFLGRCLSYKLKASRKRKLGSGIVVFNYRDYNNMIQKTEVTEDFSCPFCLMLCGSFKGLRFHLSSSHDFFEFEFWMTEDYKAVNVTVKLEALRCEAVASGIDPRLQTFFFCPKRRKRHPKVDDAKAKQANVQFLELESPEFADKSTHNGPHEMIDGEDSSKSLGTIKDSQNGGQRAEYTASGYPNTPEHNEGLALRSNVVGLPVSSAQVSVDTENVKSILISDAVAPAAKVRKLSAERSEPRNRMLLQKRQFYHSHRVQPMALEQVMADRDSEDEVDDSIADLEDRRMLDDFVDVSKNEKQFMHLWNSFVRKQRVLADGHVPWACEAFSELHGKDLVLSPPLFWCWRLFMIKLWNHGLLDASTINNCNSILERSRDEGSDTTKGYEEMTFEIN